MRHRGKRKIREVNEPGMSLARRLDGLGELFLAVYQENLPSHASEEAIQQHLAHCIICGVGPEARLKLVKNLPKLRIEFQELLAHVQLNGMLLEFTEERFVSAEKCDGNHVPGHFLLAEATILSRKQEAAIPAKEEQT